MDASGVMTPAEKQMLTEDGCWLSVQKAATCWSVCRRTLYNWIRDRKVVTVQTPGGRVRVWVPARLVQQGMNELALVQSRVA